MKRTVLLVLACAVLVLTAAGDITGYVHLGGGFDRTVSNEIDGAEITDDSGYGEGTLSLTLNRDRGFWGFYGFVNRDDFYYEKTGKISYGRYDTFMGNISSYVSYSDLDDITESDNDNGKLNVYFQSVKYITEKFYVGADANWDHVDYKDDSLGLYDYDDISLSLNGGFGDIFASLKGSKREITKGETPGYTEYTADVYGYFYPGNTVINVSLGGDLKDYSFSSDDYDDYFQNDLSLRLGHKISETVVPYILGDFTYYDERDNPGDYSKWELGVEIELFTYPLSLIAKTGRKSFSEESESRLSYTFYKAEGYWSFWTGPVSLYMGDSWELQKIDDVTSTDFPEAKNSNFINSLYLEAEFDLSRSFSIGSDVSYEWKEFFIEDEMNADYRQFSAGMKMTYNLYYKYVLNLEGELTETKYDTFTENNSKDYRITSSVQYSF